MKIIALIIALISIVTTVKSQDKKFLVDFKQSEIIWVGKKLGGEHTGTLKVKSGSMTINNGLITQGEFVIDMSSLTCSDLKDEGANATLVGHLKSPDFFDVEKYPEAKMEITESTKADGEFYVAKGQLTIKGITNPYSFRFVYKMDEGLFIGMANMEVDRAKYNVQYGSESFFKNIGDKVIYDIFDLQVKLIGKPL
ncbi:MAG: hypothetical protein CVU05_00500 [Bacteroidetes bacterium HGW-Bacteroidetes-21]|jgi:polyisoprenoid-binding protein YceI|nr:MAG: hypothetical protein CVU05_00500 [Bacteroidetes bacterium HGW-Bacteroidetes-21]